MKPNVELFPPLSKIVGWLLIVIFIFGPGWINPQLM